MDGPGNSDANVSSSVPVGSVGESVESVGETVVESAEKAVESDVTE